MKKARNSKIPKWLTKRRTILISIFIILLVIFDLSPFGGNIKFYSTWIKCGQKPVASRLSLDTSEARSYEEPSLFEPIRFGVPSYFCTPLDAEKAGYSANPSQYDFPNLNKSR